MSPPEGLVLRAIASDDATGPTEPADQPGSRHATMRRSFQGVRETAAWLAGRRRADLVAMPDGLIVGPAGLSVAEGRRRHARRGIGPSLHAALLGLADHRLDLKRAEFSVHGDNAVAIRTCERGGFVREGVMREHAFEDGRSIDALLMARLRAKLPGVRRAASARAPGGADGSAASCSHA